MQSDPNRSSRFESAIYTGVVRHRRFTPSIHEFDYSIFMLLLKADEIPQVMQKFWQLGTNVLRWGRFNRQDYVGDKSGDLSQGVKSKIAEKLGMHVGDIHGDIYLLGQLRYFGFYFSPLNLYYLKEEGEFKYMLAEVSNTPWNEKHYYLINLQNAQRHSKEFHVSPFNPMDQDYQWRVVPPAIDHKRCLVHIDIFSKSEDQKKVFDATLKLNRVTLNQKELMRVLVRTPMQTFNIVTGIYWQALKLLLKRLPLYQHPSRTSRRIRKGIL